jgi:glucose-6-phosphate 1-dehydrogenase
MVRDNAIALLNLDMPSKDIYHDTVKKALEKDGWLITKEQLKLTIGSRTLYVDLAADKILAAEKEGRKIAVEIKSFLSPSPVDDLEKALGQYVLYCDILEEQEPERILYLAVPNAVFEEIFSEPVGQMAIKKQRLRLLTFNPRKEEIVQWIS